MAFKLSRIFGNRGGESAESDTSNQRGSVQFEDVQVGRALPEVNDEVVLNLNNKNPELTRYENMAQDGKFEPEVLSMDAATPKLADAIVAPPTEPNADGILPYLEQQPYHGGGEAMQDVFVTEFTGSDEELGALVAWLRNRNLIDTSTGEIVWADEAQATASDEELSALIGWLQGNRLIDTSTGEVVWARQPAAGAKWFVPDMDSDQSGMAIEQNQVFVGGFGGGVDDSRVVQPEQPQSLYFEDSVRTARENVVGDWNSDGNDTVGASSLLNADTVPTDSMSLNFEEIKQTVVDSVDIDIDGPDADIELPD